NGSDRNIQRLRDFFMTEPVDMIHSQRNPITLRKIGKRVENPIGQFQLFQLFERRWRVTFHELFFLFENVARPIELWTKSPQPIDANSESYSAKPWDEFFGIYQQVQIAERPNESFLSQVFSLSRIVNH